MTHTEQLLKSLLAEIDRRDISLRQVSIEMGVGYQTLYWFAKPERRPDSRTRKGQCYYEMGKTIEAWINKSKKHKVNATK